MPRVDLWHWSQMRDSRISAMIWCSIEMRNSSLAEAFPPLEVVIWCSIEMRNSWRVVGSYARRVVIWCSIEMRNSPSCSASGARPSCDLMLYWNEKQSRWRTPTKFDSCDLMLYWNEKQFPPVACPSPPCCDLMLYWNEKQCRPFGPFWTEVVIWCSIEMRNSRGAFRRAFAPLWFDALLKWETVTLVERVTTSSCDLMLYWNEKQYVARTEQEVVRCDLMLYWNEKQSESLRMECAQVVIWCSIEMRNSRLMSLRSNGRLWFDALLKWETVTASNFSNGEPLWFDALLKWETVTVPGQFVVGGLWFDALLKWETVVAAVAAPNVTLWFDALLKWETVGVVMGYFVRELWFDALLKWETVTVA